MSNEKKLKELTDLGYDNFFDSKFKALSLTDSTVTRVISEHKEAYRVKNTAGEFWAKISGKQMYNAQSRADYPAIGDWVAITKIDQDKAIIQNILPRKTVLRRKYSDKQDVQLIAANIDVAFIIESLDRDYNLNRIERYFVLAKEGNIEPVIVLNKADLLSQAKLNQIVDQTKQRFGLTNIFLTSTISNFGVNELSEFIKKGKTYCFLGSSGVGKSSLINALMNQDYIRTKEISNLTGRGKHTTTAREMYFLAGGGIVIDNPGTRGVAVADANTGISNVFDDISQISNKCKFDDCTHSHEPGCAVLKAIDNKTLSEEKLQNFQKLKKESEYYEMSDLEKRRKDRKFGKFIKNALKDLQ